MDAFPHGPSEKGHHDSQHCFICFARSLPSALGRNGGSSKCQPWHPQRHAWSPQREHNHTPHFTRASMKITVSISSACQLRILPNGNFKTLQGSLSDWIWATISGANHNRSGTGRLWMLFGWPFRYMSLSPQLCWLGRSWAQCCLARCELSCQ